MRRKWLNLSQAGNPRRLSLENSSSQPIQHALPGGFYCPGASVVQRSPALTPVCRLDTVTGLPNERMFFHRLSCAIRQWRQDGKGLAVLHIDLGDFKRIHGTVGPKTGEAVLLQVAKRIEAVLYRSVIPDNLPEEELTASGLFRLTGAEFAILCTKTESAESPAAVGQLIMAAMERSFDAAGTEVHVSPITGIARMFHQSDFRINDQGIIKSCLD